LEFQTEVQPDLLEEDAGKVFTSVTRKRESPCTNVIHTIINPPQVHQKWYSNTP
jgi:hypothetical protein